MTLAGTLISFFPLLTLALAAIAMCLGAKVCMTLGLGLALVMIYLFPPLAFRIHQKFAPLKPGISRISDPGYSPWWGTHQIQLIYIAFPTLESFLRLIPGLYSFWLRLWGAKIGRGIHWTPRVEVIDRSLVSIGDHVVIGHSVVLVSHVVDKKADGEQVLFVKPVQIGNGCFIGAGSVISPGCIIAEGSRLDAGTQLKLNERR